MHVINNKLEAWKMWHEYWQDKLLFIFITSFFNSNNKNRNVSAHTTQVYNIMYNNSKENNFFKSRQQQKLMKNNVKQTKIKCKQQKQPQQVS